MLEIVPTRQFQKDLTKASKRGKNLDKIGLVIDFKRIISSGDS